jgi:Zn-dependent M28 family amino/carboxypeptidase
MFMRSICISLLVFLIASVPPMAQAQLELPKAVHDAALRIDAAGLRAAVVELSGDAFEGRGPGSPGDLRTRTYLAGRLEAMGYEPAGPGGAWEQPFPIIGMNTKLPDHWEFRTAGQIVALKFWDQYIAASGRQEGKGGFSDAEVVFVGYGIEAPEENWNDFKDVDLKGKILLMLNNDPDWDPDLFAGSKRLYYGRWTYKYESAAAQGAVGAIIVHTDPSAGYPWQVVQTSWTGEQFELPAGEEARLDLAAWITEDAARQLCALAGQNYDELEQAARAREFRPVPLGIRSSLAWSVELTHKETANVVARLPGSDARLAAEHVVFTAHHDHLGIGEPDATGDTIYNGAVDNASGVAQVLAIAGAFAALQPRPARSILILPVAAEEQGLLGSRWYAMHPTMAEGHLAANINIDGGNIFGRTEDVAIVGMGKSDLEKLLSEAALLQGRHTVNELSPDKGYYYRSDQLNFAKIGVPALYFKSGQNYRGRPDGWGKQQEDEWRSTRYHQPSDEMTEDWNFDGMVEDARLAFWVGWAVASASTLPAWNPGDEFEAARLRALDAVAGSR